MTEKTEIERKVRDTAVETVSQRRDSRSRLKMILLVAGAILSIAAADNVLTHGFSGAFHVFLESAPSVVVHAVITGFFGGIIIHQLFKREELDEIKDVLYGLLLSERAVLDEMPRANRIRTIENLVQSVVPERQAKLLFNAMIKPYLTEYGIRSSFKYLIRFSSQDLQFTYSGGKSLVFPRVEYHCVGIDMTYTKTMSEHPQYVILAFAASDAELEKLVGDRNILYREGMFLDRSVWQAIATFSEEERKAAVVELMQLRLKINGQPAPLEGVVPIGMGWGFAARFATEQLPRIPGSIDVELKYRMPYRRFIERYLVTLPDPTDEPEITLIANDEQDDLAAITFMTRDERNNDLTSEEIGGGGGWRVHLENCAFPRSGVMFVWNDRKRSGHRRDFQ